MSGPARTMNPWSLLLMNQYPWRTSPDKYNRDPQYSIDADLDGALRSRYGEDPRNIAMGYASETGLQKSPIRITMNPKSDELTAKNQKRNDGKMAAGDYDTQTQKIRLDKTLLKSEIAPTMVHEIAHANDQVLTPYPYSGGFHETDAEGMPHHQYYQDIEPELSQQLYAQMAIENGLGKLVDPRITRRYPQLGGIKPQSTNLLPNPWKIQGDSQ